MEKFKEVERSIITTHRKRIWNEFVTTVKEFEMIKSGDKIAVCMSGGKDSMLLAKCMQELERHGNIPFSLVFLVMNPGYNKINKQKILDNAKLLNIPITMFDSNIFDTVATVDGSPCYLCARMRRGHLYAKAKELGCNKIALGHHFDDVIETILLGMLYNGQYTTMMPKLKSTNFEGMELIRPLYRVKEKDIITWTTANSLRFIQCACRFTENCMTCDDSAPVSKRLEMKNIIDMLRKINPEFDRNIFKSSFNIRLDTVVGYKKGKKFFSFLENYDKTETDEETD